MTNKSSNQSKIGHWIKAPIRFLGKARNQYIRFMYSCSDLAGHGDDMGVPPAYFSSVPFRTFPSSSANNLRNLVRGNSESNTLNIVGSKIVISSKSELVKNVEMEILQLRQQRQSQAMGTKVQSRKCCKVIGTIDEDNPCEFSDDLKVGTDFLQQPTNRSSTVTKRIDVIV
ncbi:uncharacterized protein LOC122663357 [Telopea speciosissima]|uniref:uncharacterized protein LOC122663357 n=1 Tax=Telopea speciosissima TaxID=54955 RepID=UPI001CC6CED9|nr:uncharacterized protein LOC122663357 [Telopea speciosissima]